MSLYIGVFIAGIIHAIGSRQQGKGRSLIGMTTFMIASYITALFFGLDYQVVFEVGGFAHQNQAAAFYACAAFIAYWMGEASGWGDMFGAFVADREMVRTPNRKSWWQVADVLKTDKYISSVVRGLIWALPLSIIAVLAGLPELAIGYVLAFATCFMVSIPLARKIKSNSLHTWGISEYIRGFYVSVLPPIIGAAIILLIAGI